MTVPAVVAGIQGVALGFQQLTPSTTTPLTPPAGATLAVIVSAGAFSWRDDGTAPTVAIGMVWPATVPLYYSGNLSKIQIINSSGTVNVSYYG